MDYIEIDLEDGQPTVKEALDRLKFEVERSKKLKVKCILVIHGYGSSGSGGKIRLAIRKWLETEEKNKIIKALVYGERFDIFNAKAIELKNKYHQLIPLLKVNNFGVTVIEL